MKVRTNIPNFEIRPAREQDVALILSFVKQLAEYERLTHEVVATEASLRESLFGDRCGPEALLAEYEGRPVGFAVFFQNYSTFLGRPGIYIEDIYVQPEFRGRGFGRAILAYLAKLAKERRCGRLEWAVLDWNEPAIEFYRGLGAVPMDQWTVYRIAGDALDKLANESDLHQGSETAEG